MNAVAPLGHFHYHDDTTNSRAGNIQRIPETMGGELIITEEKPQHISEMHLTEILYQIKKLTLILRRIHSSPAQGRIADRGWLNAVWVEIRMYGYSALVPLQPGNKRYLCEIEQLISNKTLSRKHRTKGVPFYTLRLQRPAI